ncbi:MAG TPA: hypothetical protein VL899_16170 [Alphaproteobacteria bacterium]|jgi:hypothetical protein|nr:hypothetical protein [Alphaproteobacteria bacterium]
MFKVPLTALAFLALGTASANAATYTGTVQVAITVQVKSSVPAGQKFICGVSINVYDPSAGGQGPYTGASVEKTASGGVLKCEVDIPYSWAIGTDMASVSASWSVSEGTMETGASRNIRNGLTGFTPTKNGTTRLTVTGTM